MEAVGRVFDRVCLENDGEDVMKMCMIFRKHCGYHMIRMIRMICDRI
jgi:hypothetical protein